MAKLLDGKVAIVTGGGGGLGSAICQALAIDGAKIVVVGRDEKKCEAALERVRSVDSEAVSCCVDLTQPESPDKVVAAATAAFGGIDILVNCAGVFVWKKMLDQTREDWDRTLGTNLSAPFFVTQSVARTMVEQERGGAILNITSIHGALGDASVVGHCASKFGLVGLTKAAAEALREHGIRVNAIAPGQIAPDSGDRRGASPQEPVTQCDIATLAVFLVSDLSRTLTGSVIDAWGNTRGVIKSS